LKVNAYDKPINYLLASLFWNPKTMWIEVSVKLQKKELSCVQIHIKLHSSAEVPTTSRQINEQSQPLQDGGHLWFRLMPKLSATTGQFEMP
jgi:hypothetical protein